MAAGAAEGVGIWSLNPGDLTAVTCERFEPQINPEGKTLSCYLRSCKLNVYVQQIVFSLLQSNMLIEKQLYMNSLKNIEDKICSVWFREKCISVAVLSVY